MPRAREFVGTVIPRVLSFIIGVVARMVEELSLADQQMDVVQCLSACTRRGFDTPAKLEFANSHRSLIGRVEVHQAYSKAIASLFDDLNDF